MATRPPSAVPDGRDLVQPEDVNVQLRATVAADVLREDGHRDLVGVLEPAGLRAIDPPAVMTGPHKAAFALPELTDLGSH